MGNFTIRQATEADTALILSFIKKLAEYEKMSADVVADEETLRRSMFDEGGAEALIGDENGKPVAFALYFYNFSTFLGRRGLYLEDIFVLPEMRGKGYGKLMLKRLAQVAAEQGCGRFEWACLDWNKPAQGFYRSLGAAPMEEWTIYRLTGEKLNELARPLRPGQA